MKQIVPLCAPGMSGRAVKIQTISGSEKDDAAVSAARQLDPDSPLVEFEARRIRECCVRMVIAISKEPVMTAQAAQQKRELHAIALEAAKAANAAEPIAPKILEMTSPELEWIRLKDEDLLDVSSPRSYDRMFNPKEQDVLRAKFRELHDTTQKELAEIQGKSLTIADDE